MRKKGYKQMQRRLLLETRRAAVEKQRRTVAEDKVARATDEAEYYKSRFRKMGSNVETVDPGRGKAVAMETWELEPEAWGNYVIVGDETPDDVIDKYKDMIVSSIVRGLIDRNIVQFIPGESWGPITGLKKLGAKLYVVPWEQMPHEKTVTLQRYVENAFTQQKYEEDGHDG